jgi:uncharacterized protein (TIGR00255 family)
MALQSMTGFARVEGYNDTARWIWEVRSVNGKSLDFRLRLPPGSDEQQLQIRKLVSKYFSRGNLQINLTIERQDAVALPVVNQPELDTVIAAIASLQERLDCPAPAAEQILAIKGVMETGAIEESEEQKATLADALMKDFDKLMKELEKARAGEGDIVVKILENQLDKLNKLTLAITNDPSRKPDQIKIRLESQISVLLDNTAGLDFDRLHQEAAILAAKADLREELDRLNAHIGSARQLLSGDGPVGRRLDFLCQEFNRECNTICSKSNASPVTAAGLDMKVVIDQIREQVQNLE